MKIYLHTLGDSTWDNIFHLLKGDGSNLEEARQKSVEGQLQQKLGEEIKVESHAYDGFTTTAVLNGGCIGAVFPWGGTKVNAYIRHKLSQTRITVRPLDRLAQEIAKDSTAIHYVAISVGGNDFRENLSNPYQLLTAVSAVQKRYLEVVERVMKLGPHVRPILMFQYRTAAEQGPYHIYTILGFVSKIGAAVHLAGITALAAAGIAIAARKIGVLSGGVFILIAAIALYGVSQIVPLRVTLGILKGQNPGITMIGALMEKFYRPILQRVREKNLPVLDLPNSFNPYEKLYISEIEPNEAGGTLIAEGISHIIKGEHDYKTGKIYRCNGMVSAIPDHWEVEYKSAITHAV